MSQSGYGAPPEHSRFRKGQSGNPRGRPKRQASFGDELLGELSETIQVTENGRLRRISKQRALIKAMTAGALKGDARAAALLMRWCAELIDKRGGPVAPTLSASDRKIVEDYLERQVEQRLAAQTGKEPTE